MDLAASTQRKSRNRPTNLRIRIDGFCPEAFLARALEGIFRSEGADMYRPLRQPATRQALLALADRMERAWRTGERSGRWAGFTRAVRRLQSGWLALLADGSKDGASAVAAAAGG